MILQRECFFHSNLIFLCLFTHTHCHSWLHNARDSHLIHFWFYFFTSLFDYSMLTWKTGCVSVRSVSPERCDRLWFHMVPMSKTRTLNFCFLHLHKICFHLGFSCQYVSGTQALFLRAVTGPIS